MQQYEQSDGGRDKAKRTNKPKNAEEYIVFSKTHSKTNKNANFKLHPVEDKQIP